MKIPAIEQNYKEILRLVEMLKKDKVEDMVGGMRAECEMITVNCQAIIKKVEEYWTEEDKMKLQEVES